MDTLRKPIFFLAVALIVITVLTELGTGFARPSSGNDPGSLTGTLGNEYNRLLIEDPDALGNITSDRPPGIGILYLALVDGVVLFTVALMAISLLIPAAVQGRLQGC